MVLSVSLSLVLIIKLVGPSSLAMLLVSVVSTMEVDVSGKNYLNWNRVFTQTNSLAADKLAMIITREIIPAPTLQDLEALLFFA